MIAVKYKGGMIVAKEYVLDQSPDVINRKMINLITVNDPYVIGSPIEKDDECVVLLPNHEVFNCKMSTVFTKNKIRLIKGEQTEFIKEQWQNKF